MSSTPATEFAVGQRIVYPSQGVGKIVDIQEKSFKDASVLYYTIYLDFSDMTVMVPVDKAAELASAPSSIRRRPSERSTSSPRSTPPSPPIGSSDIR